MRISLSIEVKQKISLLNCTRMHCWYTTNDHCHFVKCTINDILFIDVGELL